MGLDDFAAKDFRAAEICSQARAPPFGSRLAIAGLHFKAHVVTDETQQAITGRGRHDWDYRFHRRTALQSESSERNAMIQNIQREAVDGGSLVLGNMGDCVTGGKMGRCGSY